MVVQEMILFGVRALWAAFILSWANQIVGNKAEGFIKHLAIQNLDLSHMAWAGLKATSAKRKTKLEDWKETFQANALTGMQFCQVFSLICRCLHLLKIKRNFVSKLDTNICL